MTNLPLVVPVLDLQGGLVVRGVAGQRQNYQPLNSRLTPSCEPAEVAAALQAAFRAPELYLADLDAITRGAPDFAAWRRLGQLNVTLWIDAGRCLLTPALCSTALAAAPAARWVLGLESVQASDELTRFAHSAGAEAARAGRLVFSLDLRQGRLDTACAELADGTPEEVARRARDAGFRRIIVLDLADVGVGAGVSTCALVARLRAQFPDLHLTAGGGVRGRDDLSALGSAGCDAVLAASALHDGRLTPELLAPAPQV